MPQMQRFQTTVLPARGGQNFGAIFWLRYTNLYRAMAEDRDTLIFKAALAVNIARQLAVLEKLLSLAPGLANIYDKDILLALKNDAPVFRDPYIVSDNFGLVEPFSYGLLGNAHAVQNDFFSCLEGFKTLAEKPLEGHPRADKYPIPCPWREGRSTFEMTAVYPVITPGSSVVNAIYSLLIGGLLQGDELIGNMKIMRVRFRQAQLAITILSQNVSASEISAFVKSAPPYLQNPITNAPFEWDEVGQSLSFERPDTKDKYKFRINVKK